VTDFSDESWDWYVLDVNPEPWAIGPVSVGRRKGGVYPVVGRNEQLWFYQQAIKEAIGNPSVFIDEGKFELMFFFWRDRAEYKTHQARTHRKHEADVTNLAKATEDALQGILFKNDRDTRIIHAEIVEQGPGVNGKVVVGIRPVIASTFSTLPDHVQQLVDELDSITFDNDWTGE